MPSILIVDDEPDIRFLVGRMLRRGSAMWRIHEAASGPDGLRSWRALRPDVVVLDQRMAGCTGLETAACILAEDPEQAIVLYTGFPDARVRERAAALGIRACVPKSELWRLVSEVRALGGSPAGSTMD